MKKENLLLGFALFLGACSSDLPSSQTGKVELKLAASELSVKSSTRSESSLPEGISTGVYVTTAGGALADAFYSNVEYKADATGKLQRIIPCYLTLALSYDIYSYAPYKASVASPSAITFAQGDDVLLAPKATITNVTETNSSTVLTYNHLCSQISFNVVFADDYTYAAKTFDANSSVTITGFYPFATLNIPAGTLTVSGTADKSVSATASQTGGVYTLKIPAFCFFPSGGESSFSLKVTQNGRDAVGTITENFAKGTSYNYTVTLRNPAGSSELGITGKLTDWIPASGNVSVE